MLQVNLQFSILAVNLNIQYCLNCNKVNANNFLINKMLHRNVPSNIYPLFTFSEFNNNNLISFKKITLKNSFYELILN